VKLKNSTRRRVGKIFQNLQSLERPAEIDNWLIFVRIPLKFPVDSCGIVEFKINK
jgi:hypothetical protein